MHTDSLSYKLKLSFDNINNSDLEPTKFLTKIKGDSVLILVKIPDLKKVKRKDRNQVMERIVLFADSETVLKEKEKYIGVYGEYFFMMIRTPAGSENESIASKDLLAEFYGKG